MVLKANTITITRRELHRIVTAFGIGERSVQALFAAMDKAHKHINIITFANLLEKAGMDRETMGNVFRRLGMDDVSINKVFDMVDEERITAQTGRVYNATIDFS